jgi:hypothetical protein
MKGTSSRRSWTAFAISSTVVSQPGRTGTDQRSVGTQATSATLIASSSAPFSGGVRRSRPAAGPPLIAPAGEEPTVDEPTVDETAAEGPDVDDDLAAGDPAGEEPAAEGPVVDEPAVDETAAEGTNVGGSAVEDPTPDPSMDDPAANDSGADESGADESGAHEADADESDADESDADESDADESGADDPAAEDSEVGESWAGRKARRWGKTVPSRPPDGGPWLQAQTAASSDQGSKRSARRERGHTAGTRMPWSSSSSTGRRPVICPANTSAPATHRARPAIPSRMNRIPPKPAG